MEYKPDFEDLRPYYEAFWQGEVLDKVAVSVRVPKRRILPETVSWSTPLLHLQETPEQLIDRFEEECRHTFFGGLCTPSFFPNFGPDAFSAFLGAELKFSRDTRETSWIDWSKPVLKDYCDLSCLKLDPENPLYQKNLEILRKGVERGKGKFLVACVDLHGGFDALSALRGGPAVAAVDLLENPEGVKEAMKRLFLIWRKISEDYFSIVLDEQPGTTSWMEVWAKGRTGIVQSDLSCLLSPKLFQEFLLEEICAEIESLDYSFYHLDGEGALPFLDMLLEIPRLRAIQWVPGARYEREGPVRWFHVYQKIQAKKKSVLVYTRIQDIPQVLANLKPEGLLLVITDCQTEEEARRLMKELGWK